MRRRVDGTARHLHGSVHQVSRGGRIRTAVLIGFCAVSAAAAVLCNSTLRAQLAGDEVPAVEGPTASSATDEQARSLFDGPDALESETAALESDTAPQAGSNSLSNSAKNIPVDGESATDASVPGNSSADDAVEVLKKFKALRASRQWKKLQNEKIARAEAASATAAAITEAVSSETTETENTPVGQFAIESLKDAAAASVGSADDATKTVQIGAKPDSQLVEVTATPAEQPSVELLAKPSSDTETFVPDSISTTVPDSLPPASAAPLNTGALNERALNAIRKHKAQTVARRWKQLASMKRMAGQTAPQVDPTDALAAAISESDLQPVEEVTSEDVAAQEPEEATHPSKLKPLSAIAPYIDYEPDAGRNKAVNNQCPCKTTDGCECPTEITFKDQQFVARMFPHSQMSWEASNIYHLPIYFEDWTLERYGHTHGTFMQPAVSMGIFSAQFFGLPYQRAIDPVAKRRYTLGWYRPGANVPAMYYQIPWNTKAALTAAGVYTAGTFVFP